MKRRTLLFAAVTFPLSAVGQTRHMPRIGVLSGFDKADPRAPAEVEAFRAGLTATGWIEGVNLQVEYKWGGGNPARERELAKELVASKPDVLVGRATVAVAALLRETTTIPVVFAVVSDPIGTGFVQSLAKPGRNATGFLNVDANIGRKWIERLKEIAPSVSRIGVMFNPNTSPLGAPGGMQPLESAAGTFKLELAPMPVRDDAAINAAFQSLAQAPGAGLVLAPDQWFTDTRRERTIRLHREHKVPAIGPNAVWVREGLLAAYGVNNPDLFRRAAGYVGRILRGDNVSELPVQLPERFEMAINVKAAEILGLTVPPSILASADEVIE